jgi:hypothetical protein
LGIRHGRDAADFGTNGRSRAAGDAGCIVKARRRTKRPKSARPFGLRRKPTASSSQRSTVFPDTLFALLLPVVDFRHAARLMRNL